MFQKSVVDVALPRMDPALPVGRQRRSSSCAGNRPLPLQGARGICCFGALDVFQYTGKASTHAKYISDRAKDAHGLTYSQALQLQYRSRNGELVAHTANDLEYNLNHGYLEVASQ